MSLIFKGISYVFLLTFFKGLPLIILKLISFFIARYLTDSLRGPVLTLHNEALCAEFWVRIIPRIAGAAAGDCDCDILNIPLPATFETGDFKYSPITAPATLLKTDLRPAPAAAPSPLKPLPATFKPATSTSRLYRHLRQFMRRTGDRHLRRHLGLKTATCDFETGTCDKGAYNGPLDRLYRRYRTSRIYRSSQKPATCKRCRYRRHCIIPANRDR